jgi:hypothetical protein
VVQIKTIEKDDLIPLSGLVVACATPVPERRTSMSPEGHIKKVVLKIQILHEFVN